MLHIKGKDVAEDVMMQEMMFIFMPIEGIIDALSTSAWTVIIYMKNTCICGLLT